MKPLQEIFPLLSESRKTVIVTHMKPDADAMGASLALQDFLRQLQHPVTVISPTNWAGWVAWMHGAEGVVDYEMDKEKANKLLDEAEWLFCVDFNTLNRTRKMADKIRGLHCTKILIDHHQQPEEGVFDFGASDPSKSSTCEMIYDLIIASGHADKINETISECIYAGIVGDTGSFRFSSTNEHVHKLVADLKGRGLDHAGIHEHLFDNFLENRLRFVGHVLLHRMEVLYEYNTVLISIPKSDLLRFHIKTGDTEGLINFPQTIRGIRLVALVIDRDEERKWSFRSKGDFDCNNFARKYFNGGGHFYAAGGNSQDSLQQTTAYFKKILKENAKLLQS